MQGQTTKLCHEPRITISQNACTWGPMGWEKGMNEQGPRQAIKWEEDMKSVTVAGKRKAHQLIQVSMLKIQFQIY